MEMQIKVTTDHDFIRRWVEQHHGKPAIVRRTIYNDVEEDLGVLRIRFQDSPGIDHLEEISWGRFFRIFEEKNHALAYKEKTNDGKPSCFFEFVHRPGRKSSSAGEAARTKA